MINDITYYDLIIIGGGPAGTAAAVYAARKQLKTLIIAKKFGGQSDVSPLIYNWIGTPEISGIDLAASMKNHVYKYKGEFLTIKENVMVEKISNIENGFTVITDENENISTKTILVSSGSNRRKLSIPTAEKFENKGVVYCATCDGPLFANQDVVVIGGGNAGFETAAQLTAYCKSVTLLQRSKDYRADEITVKNILAKENMKGILNAKIKEVKGANFVTGITYEDGDGNLKELTVTGIFVEIGQTPNTVLLKDITNLKLDKYQRIMIDPWTQKTTVKGIWAAGDCTNVLYHQNNISAGDAIKALEDIYMYIHG